MDDIFFLDNQHPFLILTLPQISFEKLLQPLSQPCHHWPIVTGFGMAQNAIMANETGDAYVNKGLLSPRKGPSPVVVSTV